MPASGVGVDFTVEVGALLEHAETSTWKFHRSQPAAYDPGATLSHDAPAADTVANEPQFLNALEVATALRVSRSTVYNLIASGRLVAQRHGGGKIRPRGVRVPKAAVEAYLSSSLIAPPEEVA